VARGLNLADRRLHTINSNNWYWS